MCSLTDRIAEEDYRREHTVTDPKLLAAAKAAPPWPKATDFAPPLNQFELAILSEVRYLAKAVAELKADIRRVRHDTMQAPDLYGR
jgi:hypothetical protein